MDRVYVNNSMALLAFGLFRDQGVSLQACAGLSKSDNTGIGTAQRPRRASPEALIGSKQPLLRTKAINGELRLAADRFRARRSSIELFRETQLWLTIQI